MGDANISQAQTNPKDFQPLPYVPGAVVSLVCGILGIFLAFCFGVAIVLSIVALIIGSKAKKDGDANPTKYQGTGLAVAGFVLGIIGIIINIFFITIIVLYLSFFISIFNRYFFYLY